MTAEDDASVVSLFLTMLCLPHVTDGYVYLFEIGFRYMSPAEVDAMLLMLLPAMVICFICFTIMGIGFFIDSGGLDV